MPSAQNGPAVVALAGRRIDPEPTQVQRFPFDQVERVRAEIADRLRQANATVLVCSAACGADLIALEIAQNMGVRTRIILPFSAARFRETSVVDRPRPEFWGSLFDRVTKIARARGDLVELDGGTENDAAYSAANVAIINEARTLAGVKDNGRSGAALPLIALVVWEGAARGVDDNTERFAGLARRSDFRVESILTVNTPKEPMQP